jgi:zinc protease
VAAIELLGEIVKEPALAADEFETVMTESLAGFEQSLSDPRARGMNAMSRALNPWPTGSIHYVPTLEEGLSRLRAVTIAEIKGLYSKFFGAENLTVAVVGDFDEDEVAAAIERVFGSWKSSSPYQRIGTPFRPYKADDLTILTPDKQMATVGMGANFEMRDDDPDYPALTFAGYILGESAKSRLLNRLRHQGGLSYGAGASLRADSEDRRASINATAICAPQNAVKAAEAMREEIVRWIADGVTAEELEEGKTSYALRFENSLANDRFVLGQLVSGLEIDRTFAYQDELYKKIQALTLADIKRALEKHLGSAAFVQMKAGDLDAATREAGDEPAETATALPERLAAFDANGDGKLQKSEAPERMQEFFDRMDANGDGTVDAAEAAAMRGQGRGPGGPGREGERGRDGGRRP